MLPQSILNELQQQVATIKNDYDSLKESLEKAGATFNEPAATTVDANYRQFQQHYKEANTTISDPAKKKDIDYELSASLSISAAINAGGAFINQASISINSISNRPRSNTVTNNIDQWRQKIAAAQEQIDRLIESSKNLNNDDFEAQEALKQKVKEYHDRTLLKVATIFQVVAEFKKQISSDASVKNPNELLIPIESNSQNLDDAINDFNIKYNEYFEGSTEINIQDLIVLTETIDRLSAGLKQACDGLQKKLNELAKKPAASGEEKEKEKEDKREQSESAFSIYIKEATSVLEKFQNSNITEHDKFKAKELLERFYNDYIENNLLNDTINTINHELTSLEKFAPTSNEENEKVTRNIALVENYIKSFKMIYSSDRTIKTEELPILLTDSKNTLKLIDGLSSNLSNRQAVAEHKQEELQRQLSQQHNDQLYQLTQTHRKQFESLDKTSQDDINNFKDKLQKLQLPQETQVQMVQNLHDHYVQHKEELKNLQVAHKEQLENIQKQQTENLTQHPEGYQDKLLQFQQQLDDLTQSQKQDLESLEQAHQEQREKFQLQSEQMLNQQQQQSYLTSAKDALHKLGEATYKGEDEDEAEEKARDLVESDFAKRHIRNLREQVEKENALLLAEAKVTPLPTATTVAINDQLERFNSFAQEFIDAYPSRQNLEAEAYQTQLHYYLGKSITIHDLANNLLQKMQTEREQLSQLQQNAQQQVQQQAQPQQQQAQAQPPQRHKNITWADVLRDARPRAQAYVESLIDPRNNNLPYIGQNPGQYPSFVGSPHHAALIDKIRANFDDFKNRVNREVDKSKFMRLAAYKKSVLLPENIAKWKDLQSQLTIYFDFLELRKQTQPGLSAAELEHITALQQMITQLDKVIDKAEWTSVKPKQRVVSYAEGDIKSIPLIDPADPNSSFENRYQAAMQAAFQQLNIPAQQISHLSAQGRGKLRKENYDPTEVSGTVSKITLPDGAEAILGQKNPNGKLTTETYYNNNKMSEEANIDLAITMFEKHRAKSKNPNEPMVINGNPNSKEFVIAMHAMGRKHNINVIFSDSDVYKSFTPLWSSKQSAGKERRRNLEKSIDKFLATQQLEKSSIRRERKENVDEGVYRNRFFGVEDRKKLEKKTDVTTHIGLKKT